MKLFRSRSFSWHSPQVEVNIYIHIFLHIKVFDQHLNTFKTREHEGKQFLKYFLVILV